MGNSLGKNLGGLHYKSGILTPRHAYYLKNFGRSEVRRKYPSVGVRMLLAAVATLLVLVDVVLPVAGAILLVAGAILLVAGLFSTTCTA